MARVDFEERSTEPLEAGWDEPTRPPAVRRLVDPRRGRIEGLDGLRAIAVIAVLVFHLWPAAAPGGFLGVDVFFVISGFLITTLLLRERNTNGHVDLGAFWMRRARRLLPPLVLVVFTSVAAARLVDTDLLVNIGRQALGAATFSTNWLEIAAGTDYFDASAPSLFVTFWSLAVEEQFYLVWPLVFAGLIRLRTSPAQLARGALGVAAASAVFMAVLYDPTGSATRVYYGTDTHVFGLMIGVALAFAITAPIRLFGSGRWQRLRIWIGFVALAGLVGLVLLVRSDATSTYRGGILLASLLSAVMVASLPGSPTAFTAVCRFGPLAYVGERSYGIYLWHWPVLVIATEALPAVAPGTGPPPLTVALVLGVTLVLTEASYRWIEAPIRRDGFRATAWTVAEWFGRPHPKLAPGLHLPGVVTLCVSAVVVTACVGFATAPEKSQAQLSVEAGERAIEAQPAPSSTVPAGENAAGSAAAPAWPPALAVPPGDLILGLGDSVLSGAAPAVYTRFPGVYLDAVPIRQWRDVPALVQQMIEAGTIRPVVVLQFGTNAGFKYEESEIALRETLDLLGPDRRVVLVTIVGVSEWVPSTNDTLRSISAEYPNTVVADWYAVTRSRPDLLHTDRTHPNLEGIDVYAELLATSMEELGPA